MIVTEQECGIMCNDTLPIVFFPSQRNLKIFFDKFIRRVHYTVLNQFTKYCCLFLYTRQYFQLTQCVFSLALSILEVNYPALAGSNVQFWTTVTCKNSRADTTKEKEQHRYKDVDHNLTAVCVMVVNRMLNITCFY